MEDIHGMGEYAWAEAIWRVLVEAIEEMQRKLEGPVSDVQMNGFFLLIQVCFYGHRFPRLASWDSVDYGGRYDAFQLVEGIKEFEVIPMLRPQEEEMLVPTVGAFMKTDGSAQFVLGWCAGDMAESYVYMLTTDWCLIRGVLLYKERLERAHEELRAEKGKHVDILRTLEFWKSHANELEARLKMCATPDEAQDTRYQPGGDVGKDVQSDSGFESLARAVTDLGEVTAYEFNAVKCGEDDATCQTTADILSASCDAQSTPPKMVDAAASGMPPKMVDAAASVDDCDDIGDAPQCSELHVQPSAEVEDVGGRAVDATAIPCGEVVVGAQEPSEPVVRESDALLGPHVGEEAENTDAPGPGIDEVYMGGDSIVGEAVCTTPASLIANVQDRIPAATERVEYELTVDPGMTSVHHGPPMTADSVATDHEACIQAPLGESITGEAERMSPDADDVGCEDDGGGKSSNIVACMRRKPRCRKPTAVHGSPFTDPTRSSGARKSKKERNEGMTGADEPRTTDDLGEGSVHPSILDVQPLSVEGSDIGPSVEELNKL
ncbi:hypothetical protein Cgig2_017467 [Carnegiea gigantea]|uniref:Uncharacterized protein n=1 Tax=Carnegiea gigantea TaxID=171969 RepID=A0A9Q1GZM8_9CARY|nr:hypothetical protein Cgig2_017467 [Carnegiea gigantea]